MKFFLVVCFSCCFICLSAQTPFILSGTVRAAAGEPVANATVIARTNTPDSLMVAFVMTNNNGHYQLKIPPSRAGQLLLISASSMGFATDMKVIHIKDSITLLHFILSTKATELKEVVVNNKPKPFRAKNDTTTYDVSQYMDGTERKVEDILKKLPGIKVSENGTISYKGKVIDKIMLDGDDFFEKNYKLLSKNVSAALIEKIEAIENYSENGLLKGIQPSEKVVLNLRFKKKMVSSLFGSTEAGGGITSRYSVNTTLFSFVGKVKAGLLGNINNTGFDALDDARYSLNLTDAENLNVLNPESGPIASPINYELPAGAGIDKQRYISNQARLGAMQISVPVTKKSKLSIYGYWQKDERRIEKNSFNQYLLTDSVFTITEYGRNSQQPLNALLRWKFQTSPDDHSTLTYTGTWSATQPKYQYAYYTTSPIASETIQAGVNNNNHNLLQRLVYIRRFSTAGALVAEATYKQTNLTQQNSLFPYRYEPLFGAAEALTNTRQQFVLNEKNFTAKASWLGIKNAHTYELSMAYSWYNSPLTSFINLEKATTSVPIENNIYLNNIRYRKHSLVAEIKDEFTTGKLAIAGGITGRLVKLNFQEANAPSNSHNLVYATPYATLKFRFSDVSKLQLQVQQQYSLSGVTDLYSNYVFSDYRSLAKGDTLFTKNNRLLLNLRYSYVNNDKYLFSYLNGSYEQQTHPYISSLAITDSNVNLISRIPIAAKAYTLTLNGELSKYLPLLQTRFGINETMVQLRMNTIVNNSGLRQNTLTTFTSNFYGITAFDTWINFDYDFSYATNHLKNNGSVEVNEKLLKNTTLRQKLSFRLLPIKSLRLKISGEHFVWNASTGNTITYFLDATLKWLPPKKRYSFEIRASNLLNNSTLAYNSINNQLISQNSYQLVPRIIMAYITFDF